MKILLVGSFLHPMYAPAFYKSWKEMGHEVEKINYNDYGFKGVNIFASFLNRLQGRYHYGLYMQKYNHEILQKACNFKPDFVFLYRCYHIYGETVKKIGKNAIVFSYNNDDPFSGVPSNRYYRHYYDDARYCHLNYVYRKKNIADFKAIGVENTKVLLPYYIKESNFPMNIEKDIPIAFMGHFEDDGRDKYILKLKEANLPVIVYGDDNWKKAPLYDKIKDVVFPAKRGKDYNETINRTKICLVFFSKLNHDTYTRRCFEIPITRGVMLSEYTDDMNELFPDGECAVYFRDTEELVEKAKYLISNPAGIDHIAQNAFNRLEKLGASEFDRCEQIINDYKILSKR